MGEGGGVLGEAAYLEKAAQAVVVLDPGGGEHEGGEAAAKRSRWSAVQAGVINPGVGEVGKADGGGEGGGVEVEVAVVVAMATERAAVVGDPSVVDPGVGEVGVGEVGEVDGRTAERTSVREGGGGEVEAAVERAAERAEMAAERVAEMAAERATGSRGGDGGDVGGEDGGGRESE
uniref:OSJNBa0065B15.13 protein n=1 Tax=Oryza sativa subsp. japonica TaxID=39947 RepID=Q7XWT8_ORYSJ|nr:OSJNBa0065B15.13 [Oryza sativa Japonica Group]